MSGVLDSWIFHFLDFLIDKGLPWVLIVVASCLYLYVLGTRRRDEEAETGGRRKRQKVEEEEEYELEEAEGEEPEYEEAEGEEYEGEGEVVEEAEGEEAEYEEAEGEEYEGVSRVSSSFPGFNSHKPHFSMFINLRTLFWLFNALSLTHHNPIFPHWL